MGNSYLVTGALLGMDVRIVAPRAFWPAEEVVASRRKLAGAAARAITLTEDVAEGVAGADFVATDVWVSMGEPKEVWDERIALLGPYAVTMDVLRATGNRDVKFLHCLPAFHDLGTQVGREIHERHGLDSLEVTDEVFESRTRSSSTRRRTGCTPSRRSWWPRWPVSTPDVHPSPVATGVFHAA